MGTIADIMTMNRCLDIENFLELAQNGDGWCLQLLVRDPVKYIASPPRVVLPLQKIAEQVDS